MKLLVNMIEMKLLYMYIQWHQSNVTFNVIFKERNEIKFRQLHIETKQFGKYRQLHKTPNGISKIFPLPSL